MSNLDQMGMENINGAKIAKPHLKESLLDSIIARES